MDYSTPGKFVGNSGILVKVFDEFANNFSILALKLFLYLTSITIGLYNLDYLSDSTLVKCTSHTVGFMSGVISGIVAYLFAFIVPYKYDFARDVYGICSCKDFQVPISLMFLSLLFSFPLIRIIDQTITSYNGKKIIFIVSIIGIIVMLSLFFEYINSLDNRYAYLFSYSVWGIIYSFLFMQKKTNRSPSVGQTQNNFNYNPFNQ